MRNNSFCKKNKKKKRQQLQSDSFCSYTTKHELQEQVITRKYKGRTFKEVVDNTVCIL